MPSANTYQCEPEPGLAKHIAHLTLTDSKATHT